MVRLQPDRIRVSRTKRPCGCSGWMSPFGNEIQKEDPSTNVTAPEPNGPAAVSAFHPAIPAPSRNRHQRALAPQVTPVAAKLCNRRYSCILPDARVPTRGKTSARSDTIPFAGRQFELTIRSVLKVQRRQSESASLTVGNPYHPTNYVWRPFSCSDEPLIARCALCIRDPQESVQSIHGLRGTG